MKWLGSLFGVSGKRKAPFTITVGTPEEIARFHAEMDAKTLRATTARETRQAFRAAHPVIPHRGPRRVIKLPGGTTVEVHGEWYHRESLAAVMSAAGGASELVVSLRPEPDNPYDPHAIKVMVGRRLIGYIPKGSAPEYAAVAARIRELGCDAQCTAMVNPADEVGVFEAVLDLGTPEECLRELGRIEGGRT